MADRGGTATPASASPTAVEAFARIRRDLYEAIEQRGSRWRSGAGRPTSSADLERRIGELWRELRAVRAEALYAPRDQIIASARAEARVERQRRRL